MKTGMLHVVSFKHIPLLTSGVFCLLPLSTFPGDADAAGAEISSFECDILALSFCNFSCKSLLFFSIMAQTIK